jgi:hypothetical protein
MSDNLSFLPFYPQVSYQLPPYASRTKIAVASDGTIVLVTQVMTTFGANPQNDFYCAIGTCADGTIQFQPATSFFHLDGTANGIDVSIDDNSRVVFVFSQNGDLWYVTGRLGQNRYITWNDGVRFDSGDTPSVVINNSGWVLEAHRSTNDNSRVFYHFGSWNEAVIDGFKQHGKELGGIQVGALDSVSSALNSNGNAVVGWSGGVDSGTLCFRLNGVVQGGKEVKWAYLQSGQYASGGEARLSIDANGRVFASYNPSGGLVSLNIRYCTGQITDDGKKIDFNDEANYGIEGDALTHAVSPAGNYVVLFYQSVSGTFLAYADGI